MEAQMTILEAQGSYCEDETKNMYFCYKTENYRIFYWKNNIFILKKGGLG